MRAGAVPSPRHGWQLRKVTGVRPQGMAAGEPGSGYYIPSTRAMCKSPNPSLNETTPGKEPPGHASVPATSKGSEAMDLPRVTPSKSLEGFR